MLNLDNRFVRWSHSFMTWFLWTMISTVLLSFWTANNEPHFWFFLHFSMFPSFFISVFRNSCCSWFFITWTSQTFIIQQYMFISVMSYYHSNISIHALCFFMIIIFGYQNRIYLCLQSKKCFNHNTAGLIFSSD